MGTTAGARVVLVLGVVGAIVLSGCFSQPPIIRGQGTVPGGFFLRVTATAAGLDPSWRNLTADFEDARLVREDLHSVLKVPKNEPYASDLDILDLARRGDTRTVAYIYSSNERFFGFTMNMMDLNGTRSGDPERGEPETLGVEFAPRDVSVRVPHPVFIMADNRPAYPDAPFSHIVEVTIVIDLAASLRSGAGGSYFFSPRVVNTIFKIDGRVAGQLGVSDAMRARADMIAGTFYPPFAAASAFLGDTLVMNHAMRVEKFLNDPLPPKANLYLTSSGSVDRDGYGDIVQYRWDPGDGTGPLYGANLDHAYGSGGLYDVSLVVTDNDGMTDESGFPLFLAWDLEEAQRGGGNNTTGLLLNLRDPNGVPLAGQGVANVSLELPRLEGDNPYRPGMILLELTWDNRDAELELSAASGSRAEGTVQGKDGGPLRLLLVGRPYLPSSVTGQVSIVTGTFANFQLNATVFHVPDIEAGWDGHVNHEHPRYLGQFRE